MNTPQKLSKRIAEAVTAHHENQQWEDFIVSMLSKLELSRDKQGEVRKRYDGLARHVARKLGIGEHDAHVVVQGSMRTQTTIAALGNQKFDLDVVVKLSGPRFTALRESEAFFEEFGKALHGVDDAAGDPQRKNRCWRLQYPGEPFYFDVTPAIPLSAGITGTDLRVRDPETIWSPSNPEEFADWFCTIAAKRFPFQEGTEKLRRLFEAKTTVDPIPSGPVGIDDILRRTVQLIKLHRENYYRGMSAEKQAIKPISVILVTLAAQVYDELFVTQPRAFTSAIEVALEVVDRLPDFIERTPGHVRVDNPAISGVHGENFADKWNHDGGLRDAEFTRWHTRLTTDLAALFDEGYTTKTELRIRNIFGEFGVAAWKESLPKLSVLTGLLATLPAQARSNPSAPINTGSRDTLA